MKVVSFALASPKSPFKVQLQFRRSFWQMVIGSPRVVSTFTDHGKFWSELPPSGVSVTCDSETAEFLRLLRIELETGLRNLPADERNAFKSVLKTKQAR